MTVIAGSVEIRMLCWAVVLGLVHLAIVTLMGLREQGAPYNVGPRDGAPPPVGVTTARLARAFVNFKETFVFFAVAVLVTALAGKSSSTSVLGAQLYFWARLIYVPVYALGIPGLRTVIWAASIAGLVMVLGAAFA